MFPHVSDRNVAKVAGQIVSMKGKIAPVARFSTRKMYSFIDACPLWDGSTSTDDQVQKKMTFWIENLNGTNRYQIKQTRTLRKVFFLHQ